MTVVVSIVRLEHTERDNTVTIPDITVGKLRPSYRQADSAHRSRSGGSGAWRDGKRMKRQLTKRVKLLEGQEDKFHWALVHDLACDRGRPSRRAPLAQPASGTVNKLIGLPKNKRRNSA